jgi:3-keto-L-gulonate-6-phosphate decarboxylase
MQVLLRNGVTAVYPPRLWVAYDFIDTRECLEMLDRILLQHPGPEIIHEIGRPTLLNAVLDGCRIVEEFRRRLSDGQMLVADFKGFDVPYAAEGRFYYDAGVDVITVMATAPDEAVDEAVAGARESGGRVVFDLMSHQTEQAKTQRAKELVARGADLISCHTGWSEQAAGKSSHTLLDSAFRALLDTEAQLVAMGGIKPADVRRLRPYALQDKLFAVVAGSSITRSHDPAGTVGQFLHELEALAV